MQRVPVIIDTDPGVDDIIAILLAIASPEIEILGYVTTFGNSNLDASYTNVLKTYQAIGRHLDRYPEDAGRFPNFRPETPPLLARGTLGPLQGDLHCAEYFHGTDGLGGIDTRHPDLNLKEAFVKDIHRSLHIAEGDGTTTIANLIRSRPPGSINYIALGPLTNLALLAKKDPEAIARVGRFMIMGGAVDVPGNTTPVAEFNFFADPFAVKELICSGENSALPLDRVLILSLDITTPHELPFPLYTKFVDAEFVSTQKPSSPDSKPPVTHFTSSFLERTREIMLEFGKDGMELHDIAAVWAALANPPSLYIGSQDPCPMSEGWRARKRVFDIERTGEITRGMLVVDRRDDASAYAPGANRAEVQKLLSEKLHTNDDLWESTSVPARVEVEEKSAKKEPEHGVWVVTHTPGAEALLRLLLKRVWNAEL
ncbi:nucleoside hydrolase [Coprinellus micaceus]|uniref:Nucleoside hydrolase n=1 Tax=Coprinellus micaceus TaxID=71717 RepID=A0A4Y7TUE7_COPMI|nr:nucleoside hydrolase [Coprinellus micaceus]